MVSKTRKQKQHKKATIEANGGVLPSLIPSTPKSIHLKKTRPNMKSKMKIRMGHECPVDIYEGFEERRGVLWRCPACLKESRVIGFCLHCTTGVTAKLHTGPLMSRHNNNNNKNNNSAKKSAVAGLISGVKKTKKLKLKKKK